MTFAPADSPMPPDHICPHCGAPLAAGALAGLCPACLLQQGAMADSVAGAETRPFEPPAVAELTPLFPQLEILELIGRGGMGAVYKARQKELDRVVALKILPPEICAAPSFAERFAQEARALAKLNHPGIVTIHDFGRSGELFYFLMEFVDGVNLRQLLAGGRIASREALAIVPEICDALQFAHDHGIVHRDIKPENLLLDQRGRVKVADFGIAKMLHADASDAGLGETQPAGTPQYMAPEQKEHRRADHRADIYSLGVVFYELLTGELPKEKWQPPSRKVQVDVRLDEIVLRALEVKPELRFPTAAAFRAQVEKLAQPAEAKTPPDEKVTERKTSRMATWSLGIVVFFAGLAVGTPLAEALPGQRSSYFVALVALLLGISPIAAFLCGPAVSKTIGWLKGLACVAFFLTVPVIGLGAFFLLAMSSEQLHWNPDPMEALFVPLTWVGSLLLPFAGGVLWRTAKRQEPAAAPPAPRSSAARFRRWAWIAALVCALSLLATILWRQWPAPIGAWTPDRISASGPTAGPIVVHVETVSQRGLFVWVRLRSDYRGGTLRILPHFYARLATPTFPVPVQQPPEPANLPTVVLQLTPGQPPFESFMSSSKTATISGSKRVWIGFVFPSSAAASVAMKQIASLHSLRPRGLRADQPALLLFSLTARAVKPAPDETLRGEVSFELVPRTVGQPSNSQRPAKSAAR